MRNSSRVPKNGKNIKISDFFANFTKNHIYVPVSFTNNGTLI